MELERRKSAFSDAVNPVADAVRASDAEDAEATEEMLSDDESKR